MVVSEMPCRVIWQPATACIIKTVQRSHAIPKVGLPVASKSLSAARLVQRASPVCMLRTADIVARICCACSIDVKPLGIKSSLVQQAAFSSQ